MEELMSEEEMISLNSLSQDYEVASASIKSSKQAQALTLKIALKRNIMKGALQIIGPPGLLVVVSWASTYFFIHSLFILSYI